MFPIANNIVFYLMNKGVPKSKKKEQPIRIPILLPDKLEDDLVRKLRTNPPDFKVVHIDFFKYIAQLPYHIGSRMEDDDYRQGFVPVNKSILASHIHDYRKYLDYLVEHGFLEEDKQYEVGEYSASLRYSKKYLKQKLVKTVLRWQTLVKNLLRKPKRVINQNEDLPIEDLETAKCLHLSKWIPGLEIDRAYAFEILEELLEAERLDPEKQKPPKRKWKTGRRRFSKPRPKPDGYDYVGYRHQQRCASVEKIAIGIHHEAGVDRTVGRYHSCLTSLKKEVRQALTYKGQKLVSIDVKNSQPFLLKALLDPRVGIENNLYEKVFNYNRPLVKNITQAIQIGRQNLSQSIAEIDQRHQNRTYNNNIYLSYSLKEVNKKNNNKTKAPISTIMIVNYLLQLIDNQDVKKYNSWVQSGRFYEHFADELVLRKLIPQDCLNRRDRAKEITMTILFGKNDSVKKVKKAVRAFSEVFPTVFQITELVKFGESDDRPHSALACTLQSFEADIILKHCCATLETEYPDLPIFTIHDSIVTTKGNEHIVLEVMRSTFEKTMGCVPVFKPEYWGEDSH